MKTYRTPGASATEWSPTGDGQEVQRMETVFSVGDLGHSIPVTLSLKGETTRKGMRRVVLRAEGQLPGAVLAHLMGQGMVVDPKGNQTISAHVVMQVPQIMAQQEIGNSNQTGALHLLGLLLSDLVAVLSDESNTASADYLSPSGLVASAMAGAATLDVVSGEYGEKTVRS